MIEFVPTPLAFPIPAIVPRAGGIPPALLDAIVPAPGVDPLREALRAPDLLVVTTGQQPGLFTGPLYTIHKALSAAALARLLAEEWQRPVVPVFWLAGDDHDLAEAARATWIGADGDLVQWVLRERAPDAPLTPMVRERLGMEVLEARAALEAALPETEFRAGVLAWLDRHYRPEQTVAGAFAGALAELLASCGVVCFDSTHPAAKAAAAPWLVEALRRAGDLDQALAQFARRREAAGEHLPMALGDGASLVMVDAAAGRDRLMIDEDTFHARRAGERFTLADLDGIARTAPERLSPNVLLRPIVESALLPTVAYLAGPGELRYLPYAEPVAGVLEVPRPASVPRWSGVLMEPFVRRVLAKFETSVDELLAPGEALEARIARAALPDEALDALARLREEIVAAYAVVERVAVTIDPTLARPVKSAQHHAVSGTQEVEKKLIQHQKRREGVELGQVARARTSVRPGGHPQERVLTIAPFLARYGPELLPALGNAIAAWYRVALARAVQPS